MAMTLDELVVQLRLAYGDTLRAVVLYGSGASEDHIAKRSDYNVLVIADDLGSERLRAAAAVAGSWADAGNPPPLTLTTAEWRSSADIFPMEYADILERHRVLDGDFPLDGITVTRDHLRLEVEQQAMGKLLLLRRGVLAAGGEDKRQVELLERSLSTLMTIFRGVVRLHGESPPAGYEALAERIGGLAGFASEPFVRVVRHVRAEQRLPKGAAADVLSRYLESMERLVKYLDRFAAS